MVPLMPTRFKEFYDERRLLRAHRVLVQSQAARNARIEQLKAIPIRIIRPHQYNLLRRLRRIEHTRRWVEVAVNTSEITKNPPGNRRLRERYVQYKQKALRNGSLYGRRYASTSETIESVAASLPYHQRLLGPKEAHINVNGDEKVGHRVVVTLQAAPRELRCALCALIYQDIDFFCSFPQLVWSLLLRILRTKSSSDADAIRAQTSVLKQYVCSTSQREEMLLKIMHHHQIDSRDVAKKLPLVLLHGGAYKTWTNEVAPGNRVPYSPMVEFADSIQLIVSLVLKSGEDRLYDIETQMVSAREELHRDVHSRPDSIDKTDMRIFSLILHSYEDVMLRVVVDTFTQDGWAVGSLQFDGIYVETTEDPTETDRMKLTMLKAGENVTKLVGDTFSPSLVLKPLYNCPCKAAFEDWATAHFE